MVRRHRCVSVHCHQCTDTPTSPMVEAHYPDETTALDAAMAAGWVVAPDGRLLCSACGPVLVCEAEGHEFTDWQSAVPGRVFRYCARCCLHESRPHPTADSAEAAELGEVA